MRKFLIIALILSLVLVGCTTPGSDNDTTNTLDSHLRGPSEDLSFQTDPTVLLEDETSEPVTSDTIETTSTVPDPTENRAKETEPAGSTEGTTQTQPPQ